MLNTGTDAIWAVTFQPRRAARETCAEQRGPLTPNNRFVRAIQTIPLTPGIPYHVICGDRGKGGHKDKTKPVMTDGVVPYWSSHMETAESELIVPSGHSAHRIRKPSRRWSAFLSAMPIADWDLTCHFRHVAPRNGKAAAPTEVFAASLGR